MDQEQKTKVHEESPGVISSKRMAGLSIIAAGTGLLISVGIVSIIRVVDMPNAQIAIQAGTILVGIGAALLGVTVFEGIGNKIGGN